MTSDDDILMLLEQIELRIVGFEKPELLNVWRSLSLDKKIVVADQWYHMKKYGAIRD